MSYPVLRFACVSQGRLYLSRPDGGMAEVPSQFGETIRQRILRLEQQHEWKSQGRGAGFMGAWGARGAKAGPSSEDMPIHVTSVTGGATAGHLVYTLRTPDICGLLKVETGSNEETRLWHSNRADIGQIAARPEDGRLACSVESGNGAHIGVMDANGANLREMTDGDSLDGMPSWVPGREETLVFQTAGIGRNRHGQHAGYGAFRIERLDLDNRHLETLAESPVHDLLQPRVDNEGALWFIRRPWENPHARPPWSRTLLDVVLFPWRLLTGLIGFLNWFTILFSGKPLHSASRNPAPPGMARMILWGNVVQAGEVLRKAAKGDETPDLVPKTWELVRRKPGGGEETMARGVLSYDLLDGGQVLYSNGSAVFVREADGEVRRLAVQALTEQVVALR